MPFSSSTYIDRPKVIRLIPFLLLFCVVLCIFSPFPANCDQVYGDPLDGLFGEPDSSSRAYVPLTKLANDLGLESSWNAETGIIIISSEGGKVSLMPGSRHVVSGRKVVTLKSPPFFRDNQLMIGEDFLPVLLSLLSSSPEYIRDKMSSTSETASDVDRYDRLDRFFGTIVIDPGHGGDDGGALGVSGVKEKDLVLEVARKVKEIIDKKMGIRVVLTRNGDYFVPLEERTSMAAAVKADLFISIHANSTRMKSIRGVETFFMSLDATDDEAMAAAVAENSAIKFEGKSFDADSDLAAILFDMAQTEHLKESSRFARVLHNNLGNALDTKDRGVKQAPFIVLASASMPAVLVEVGFMSNPEDMKMLKGRKAQEGIAEAIFASIKSFKKDVEFKLRSQLDGLNGRLGMN